LGEKKMMLWPAVTLLGFLVLTALVIAMGTQSTARYEREREERTTNPRHAAPEAVGAVHA
jgi:multisubunit Na+/H+ antiporter MnhC subunit